MEGCRKSSHAEVAWVGGGDGDGDFFNNILTSSENQVCLDGDLGTKVLFQLSEATWLKYTNGSSLLFCLKVFKGRRPERVLPLGF